MSLHANNVTRNRICRLFATHLLFVHIGDPHKLGNLLPQDGQHADHWQSALAENLNMDGGGSQTPVLPLLGVGGRSVPGGRSGTGPGTKSNPGEILGLAYLEVPVVGGKVGTWVKQQTMACNVACNVVCNGRLT